MGNSSHIGIFHCSNALELIVIQTIKQLSGKYFQFFHKRFCLILFTNKQFEFDFWKSANKMVNAVICGKKIKCVHATGNKLVFYFGLTGLFYRVYRLYNLICKALFILHYNTSALLECRCSSWSRDGNLSAATHHNSDTVGSNKA